MTRAIDVSQDVPGCVDGGIRERPPVDIGGGGLGVGGGSWERAARGRTAPRVGSVLRLWWCYPGTRRGYSFIICRSESQRLKSPNRHIPLPAAEKAASFLRALLSRIIITPAREN